ATALAAPPAASHVAGAVPAATSGAPAASAAAPAAVPAPATASAAQSAAVPASTATAPAGRAMPTQPPTPAAADGPAAAVPDAARSAASADADAKTREYDAQWVRHIQAALAEGRFRLVQQPITNLGGGPTMFDLLIRMLDRSRKEILPGEFLPAAGRNNLMGPIDRWVMGAAARFAAESKPGCLFVRLSHQSAMDAALTRWLTAQMQAVDLDP